ncbi:MAG: hypothetical protein O6952_00390, partial [Planctomycetota bacterium]|nr:hypothetical protein [Planctomycetota bacterium]
MTLWRILILLPALLAISAQEKEKLKAKLQGYDLIAFPGEEVILKAKLEKDDFFQRDLEDQKIIFRLDTVELGTVISGEQGIARFAFLPDKEGTYRIQIALHGQSPYQAEEAELLLLAIPEQKPILICDIDHTVADISSLKFLITPNDEVEPLPGAADALRLIAESYQVIYLTGRDDAFMKKTKEWMQIKEIPRAPIFFWNFLGAPSQSHARYKKEQIAGFKKKWSNIQIGVGDEKGDAKAYLENGLRAYILGDDEDLPDGTVLVSSWKDLLEDLTRQKEEPEEEDEESEEPGPAVDDKEEE